MFTSIPDLPIIESWFIASVPHGSFISAWFFEFNLALKTRDTYIQDLKRDYGEEQFLKFRQNISDGMTGYFKIHVAAQKIIQINGFKMYTKPAEEEPFLLYYENGWNSDKYANCLLEDAPARIPRIIKLTSETRPFIISKLDSGFKISEKSIYSRFVLDSIRNEKNMKYMFFEDSDIFENNFVIIYRTLFSHHLRKCKVPRV